MTALLAKLGVSAQDCELAEKYFNEEAGDEVLDQFERKDLLAPSFQLDTEAWAVTRQIEKEDKRAVCVRFFNVLYAIGGASCYRLFWYTSYDNVEECALYKRMVLYIVRVTDNVGYLNHDEYSHLMEMAQYKPQKLIEAVPFLKEESELYAAAALAMYFCKKYENPGAVAAEDAAFMAEYENIVLGCLDTWLAGQGVTAHEEAVAALREQRQAEKWVGRMEFINVSQEDRERFSFISTLAYLNFQLSDVLLAVVRACVAVNAEVMLNSLDNVYIGGGGSRTDICFKGADYDELFSIEPALYICWAARAQYGPILVRQLAKNQASYLKVMERDECRRMVYVCMRAWGYAANSPAVLDSAEDVLEVLKDTLQEADPTLYTQLVKSARPDYEPVIEMLVSPTPHAELAKEYLRGNCKFAELVPYDDEFGDGFEDAYYKLKPVIQKFRKHCDDQGFINRCRAFIVLRKYQRIDWDFEDFEVSRNDGADQFFADLDSEQVDIAHQLQAFSLLYKESNNYDATIRQYVRSGEKVFSKFLKENEEETIEAFFTAAAEGRYLGLHILGKEPQKYKQEILRYAKDSSNLVSYELRQILCSREDWENDVKALLNGKKASERELAIRVLLKWQREGKDYHVLLSQALENEKSAKLVTLLQRELKGEDKSREPLTKEELVQQLHQGGKKRTLAWAYETPFSPVHKTDGTIAGEEYIQAVFLCYAEQVPRGMNKTAQFLAADLNASEFAVCVSELFDKWIAQGAEAKKGWVLFAASIHGSEEMIPKLYHQIQEWPKVSRGSIAAEAVRALALNPSPRALLLVDRIARKFKHKQVKDGAARALDEAADQLGISREELADRIVPDLGFDEKMQRTFDYGGRSFKVMITPSLDIEVYDENEKKLKNLPAPGKKDDAQKAAEAYAAFKEMKKQMKAAVTSQKARLEYALSAKREWSAEAWRNLFVSNPLMHQFAIGLIWGVYEGGELVQSFRYMEDGSFNTRDEEEYTLPEQARISLVHPVELTDEEKAGWKEQLADYEITQPVAQLDRAVYRVTEEEEEQKSMERFGGYVINDLSLSGKLTGLGWYRGSIGDGGSYNTYYRKDAEIDMGVELHFSGSAVGWHQEEVTVYDARFYRMGAIGDGSYGYYDADRKNAFLLKDVPPRYFSEIVLQLASATASSDEREENWKKY